MERMEDSFEDPRIRSAFVMAPVAGFAMTQQSLKAVHVPVHIVVGKDDDQAVPETNAQPMARQIPGATLDLVPAGGHYVFLPTCNDRGKNFVKEICLDAPSVDRMRSINRALFIDADEEHGLGYEVGSTMFQGSSAS